MSFKSAKESLEKDLAEIKEAGLWKTERVIASQQKNDITLADGSEVINMCANNYLGLANNPEVIQAARDSYDQWGFGLSSVRFICGTQTVHKTLEDKVTDFLGMEASILYAACFDANTGLFETILTGEDAVISDELNHASIIDGVRLCKAARYRYKNNDMADLEVKLKQARETGARRILITTDGVTFLPANLVSLLEAQIVTVEQLHQHDLDNGFGEVYLPDALARKYVNAAKSLGWQYLFSSKTISKDPRSGKSMRHHIHIPNTMDMVPILD